MRYTHILHHGEHHPKLCLLPCSHDNSISATCKSMILETITHPLQKAKPQGYSPFRTKVPMNPILVRSPSGAPGAHASTPFRTACASPVRLDSSTSRSKAESNRTSAGIRSPTVKETISPGRSSFARMVVECESL